MLFTIVSYRNAYPPSQRPAVHLVPDNWNDWGEFRTMYTVVVYDDKGQRLEMGPIKIGQANFEQGRPALPESFDTLTDEFFSLGQGELFYESVCELDDQLKTKILIGLRDCAFNLQIFSRFRKERVMVRSLLRSIPESSVTGRFHRLAHGDPELTSYGFSYFLPEQGDNQTTRTTLPFKVIPGSSPPTNVHVLIGRNGVGKTRTLNFMTRALMGFEGSENEPLGQVQLDEKSKTDKIFANIVSVSFSAFDPFKPLPPDTLGPSGIRYDYVGLKRGIEMANSAPGGEGIFVDKHLPLKTQADLGEDLVSSLRKVKSGPRLRRWRQAVETLESDPLFKEEYVSKLFEKNYDSAWEEDARTLFSKLSSGHGAILLTLTRLVELVDERTLVLLDEPEVHLHPPLLSAFVRALSNLLIQRNGVAIIATHSPVVLQEIPRSCVWIMMRFGNETQISRPEIETFGENVGVLTREVFGLEVNKSGFHQLIADAVESENGDFDAILRIFESQLGAEGRAIARGLSIAHKRDSTGNSN